MVWNVFKAWTERVLFLPVGYVRDTNFAKKKKPHITNLLHLSLFFNHVKNEEK